MIWSDNDVANDFTTLKNEDGEQVVKLSQQIFCSYFK